MYYMKSQICEKSASNAGLKIFYSSVFPNVEQQNGYVGKQHYCNIC